ncbi:uncharacterized protein DS421_6g186740 [Arachis hypogaea]|nr:uncharacterized protein DS421_6g186740 [Arachis hypogaea]
MTIQFSVSIAAPTRKAPSPAARLQSHPGALVMSDVDAAIEEASVVTETKEEDEEIGGGRDSGDTDNAEVEESVSEGSLRERVGDALRRARGLRDG